MRAFLLVATLSTVIRVSVSASAGTWYVDSSVSSSGDGTSWETALRTIQEGINAASDGETVTVAEGVYVENIKFNGKNIILQSTGPGDPVVVANTVIDGNKAGSVVSFSGFESWECHLFGFTIRNGATSGSGGGICGGTLSVHTQAQIEYNVITGNTAVEYGGGLCYCDGTIYHNTITGNSAFYGGGLSDCYGSIQSNTIIGNSATESGGGLFECRGTIRWNTITGNSALGGGGLNGCGGTIHENTITGNEANYGAGLAYCNGPILSNTITGNEAGVRGGGLADCSGAIQSNTIADNVSERGGGGSGCDGIIQNNKIASNRAAVGGGLADSDGRIQNNTIAGNGAQQVGGGLAQCMGTIQNCIVWGNTAVIGAPQLYTTSIPTYSCIDGWSGGGEGNIASQPRFLDLTAGDYRLQGGSPCIDAGFNDPELPEFDIVGMHRIMFGGKSLRVDMGAWEYYINSVSPGPGGNAVLTWSSLLGKTYFVWTSSDPREWHWTSDDTVPSLGDTVTTWTDTTAPFLSPAVRRRYYRIADNTPVMGAGVPGKKPTARQN